MKSDGVVIIPTYNEKENIENIICKVLSLEHAFDILVIDDGSPDGTADIVKRLMTEFTGRLFIIERSGKQVMNIFSKWMLIFLITLTTF